MVASKAERLAKLQTLLASCGLEKTAATLVAEAAQVGKASKAVQAFLEQAVAQQAAAAPPPIAAKPAAADGGSDSGSSTSYKSATGEQLAAATPRGAARSKDTAAAADTPTAAKRKRPDGAQRGQHLRRGEVANAPKTPFCRVRPEEVVYADERLKDNRYLSKGDVDDDFGYKAHKDLIVTRGKSFTKEKNKKKRGSYSGGRITMASSSIKFT